MYAGWISCQVYGSLQFFGPSVIKIKMITNINDMRKNHINLSVTFFCVG